MRAIFFFIFFSIVVLMACSTKRRFKAKTSDFSKCYEKSATNQTADFFKYNQGFYEFKLVDTVVHYEGVSVDWVTQEALAPVASSASPSGYLSYIAFLDHQRAVLHTPYDTTKITFDYVINDEKYPSFQRGYYFVKDSLVNNKVKTFMTLELEDPRQKEKNMLTYEVLKKGNFIQGFQLNYATIENKTLLEGQEKILITKDLFSLVPKYYFNRKKQKLNLLWKENGSTIKIDSVVHRNNKIQYYAKERVVMEENRAMKESIQSW